MLERRLVETECRIMKKIGMVQEGVMKDQVVKDGKYEDLFWNNKSLRSRKEQTK